MSPFSMFIDRRTFLTFMSSALMTQQTTPPDLEWHDAKTLTIEGLGYRDTKAPYDRLPQRAEGVVPKPVWDLSRQSAGVAVRFMADTTALHARWTLNNKNLASPNITAVAASGLDLYTKTDQGRWHWLGIGRPTKFPDNTDVLVTGMVGGLREYIVYLPLLNEMVKLELGIPKGATIAPGPARAAGSKPILFYGTSITHGISASRSGMTHVAMLGRTFNREVINLGFSGNGRMEPEVSKFVAELDPAVFVLDCLPNMTDSQVRERAANCVGILRGAHPQTPILLVEDRNYADDFLLSSHRERNETNHAALREVYDKLRAGQTKNIYYLKADNLLGEDGESTIDGSHPTDLGFTLQAAEFAKALTPILR